MPALGLGAASFFMLGKLAQQNNPNPKVKTGSGKTNAKLQSNPNNSLEAHGNRYVIMIPTERKICVLMLYFSNLPKRSFSGSLLKSGATRLKCSSTVPTEF